MKTKPTLLLLSLALAHPCPADLFTLKDGTVLDGEIVGETADSLVLNVKITKSIRDEKTVKKADVVKREKSDPAEESFQSTIVSLTAIPDFSKEDEYARRIQIVEKFLKNYSWSSRAKEAREIKTRLEAEADGVGKGGVRYKGELLSAEEYGKNRYEMDARAAAARVTSWLAAGQTTAALREYAKMGESFSHTVPYCGLAATMKRAATTYLAQVSSLHDSYEMRMKKREEGLSLMSLHDRRVTEAAIAEESEQFDKRFQEQKSGRVGWVSVDPHHQESLKETLTYGNQQIAKLSAIPASPSPDAGEAYRKVVELIGNRVKPDEISKAISDARSAKVPVRYTEELQEMLKNMPPPTPAPEPAPSPAPEPPPAPEKPEKKPEEKK